MVGGLSVKLAGEMRDLIAELRKPREYIGLHAFLLFALQKRLRVFVWFGTQRYDLLHKFAPWALDSITAEAAFEAIACRTSEDEDSGARRLHIVEDTREVNHWVACIKTNTGGSHGDGEVPSDEDTLTFHSLYFSLGRIVVVTIADGDCGLDVQSLMLGALRASRVRQRLRTELCDFALRHVGNRALIACLRSMGELTEDVGRFELAAAGAEMLKRTDEDEAHRGDGDGPGVLAEVGQTFTKAGIRAARWKCRLHRASPESVKNVLNCLPPDCIKQLVTEYENRLPQDKPVTRTPVLLTRDSLVKDRINAGKDFFEFCRKKFGDEATELILKKGRTKYGWFSQYVRTRPNLRRFVEVNGMKGYRSVLRMYQKALKLYVSHDSAVAETDSAVAEVATAEDETGIVKLVRHIPLTARTGQQYFSTRLQFVRDWKRRRQGGAGRPKSAQVIREMLMEWYNMIRHSVDCRIMVRFPKKVLLVKAQMLQEEYCARCLLAHIEPESVIICGKWLNGLLDEMRISERVPNRKYKVPRSVLMERLKIWWIIVAKIRKLCLLHWNHDPDCKNIDCLLYTSDAADE